MTDQLNNDTASKIGINQRSSQKGYSNSDGSAEIYNPGGVVKDKD